MFRSRNARKHLGRPPLTDFRAVFSIPWINCLAKIIPVPFFDMQTGFAAMELGPNFEETVTFLNLPHTTKRIRKPLG